MHEVNTGLASQPLIFAKGGGGQGGRSEGVTLIKAHLDFCGCVGLPKLVQGGYIPSAFNPTTRILSQMPTYCHVCAS